MLKVAITGGIGSGKSTVCEYIHDIYEYPVYYSDNAAIRLANHNHRLKQNIIHIIGIDAYTPDGKYNRKYVKDIVFSDKEKLKKLTELFSVYVKNDFDIICYSHEVLCSPIMFFESALIFENNRQKDFDYVICVYADEETIRKRLKERDKISDEEITKILNNQLSPEFKKDNSDFIINTTGDNYKEQVDTILKSLI